MPQLCPWASDLVSSGLPQRDEAAAQPPFGSTELKPSLTRHACLGPYLHFSEPGHTL